MASRVPRPPPKNPAARLAALCKIARGHGGRCLASEYLGMRVPLEFECAAGHRFAYVPEQVFDGRWCATCRVRGVKKLREIQGIAVTRGGVCLSAAYGTSNEKMRFCCEVGHEWETTSASIRRGSWCPKCRGRGTTIEELNEIAARHGGRCVSRRYRDREHALTWECEQGHRFRRCPGSIVRGSWWCPQCRTVSGAVARALQVAKDRGGALVSTEGIGANARLRWRCAKGHEWISKPVSVATGRRWCQSCQRLGIEQMQAIAAERGGKCLSTEYVNTHSHLEWECEKGHRWWSTPTSIKHGGHWCPECGAQRARETRRSDAKDRR